MVKIKISRGLCARTNTWDQLHYEKCPNPDCEVGEIHYRRSLLSPICPDCGTRLVGPLVVEKLVNRMDYHLESA